MLRKNSECMPWTENHVANIEKGSGGVPTSFVQDCLSSKRVIFEQNIDRNLHMFRTDAFRKVFSEAYRFLTILELKVDFQL